MERERQESELIRQTQIQVNREEKEKELARLNELQLEERVLRLRKALQNRVSGFRTLGKYAHTTNGPVVYWRAAQENERSEECVKRSAEEMEKIYGKEDS